MSLEDNFNFEDFRSVAKKKLPAPIFHYIDGGSDDEVTLKRNTESFSKCDLVPNILASVGEPDLSIEVLGSTSQTNLMNEQHPYDANREKIKGNKKVKRGEGEN